MSRGSLIAGCGLLVAIGYARSSHADEPGFLEGHLKIVSLKTVETADARPAKGKAEDPAAYPLLVMSKDGKREIARLTADKDGNYRMPLPPGAYVLDARGRAPRGIRAKPVKFTVHSNQTVHVDFELDTGVR